MKSLNTIKKKITEFTLSEATSAQYSYVWIHQAVVRCDEAGCIFSPLWPSLHITESQHLLSSPLVRSTGDNLILWKKGRLTNSVCVAVCEMRET